MADAVAEAHRPPWLRSALALALAATTLGLARFGFSVLLPPMQADLGWSYAQAGGVNTASGLGYLAGSVAAGPVIGLLGLRRAFAGAFAVTAASLVACGGAGGYPPLLGLRTVTGVATAVLFVAGGTLATRLAEASPSPGLVLGMYVAGVGPGLVLGAALAPAVLSAPHAWRAGWLALGAAAAACAVVAGRAARDIAGRAPEGAPAPGLLAAGGPPLAGLGWAITAYALFGLGYVPFMTFAIAYYRDAGAGQAEITLFWALLGGAAAASAWTWRSLLDRARGGGALTLLLGLAAAGAAVPVLAAGLAGMVASALLFGCSFLSVVAAVAQLVRRALPAQRWAGGLAAATSLFAAGQAVGPWLVGLAADRWGGLRAGLAGAALLLAAAAGAASRQGRAGRLAL